MNSSHRISSGSGSEDSNESSGFAPTLQRHGEQPSIGGASHPNGCTPCAFYCFKRNGCRKGEDCVYCHMSHISKQRQRHDEWKKEQREKRCMARACARSAQIQHVASSDRNNDAETE